MKLSSKLILNLIFLSILGGCKEAATTAVPKLVSDLTSHESGVRNKAALKLASYGEQARPAVPNLIELLKDPNGGVRSSAAYALREIKDKKGLDAIDSYEK